MGIVECLEGREELRLHNCERAALHNGGHDVKRNLVRRRAPLHVTQLGQDGMEPLRAGLCSDPDSSQLRFTRKSEAHVRMGISSVFQSDYRQEFG